MINPKYQFMYIWDFMQRKTMINVGIRCPEDFDASQIKAELSEDKSSIRVFIPQEPPLIAGKLYKQATGIATKAQKNTFILAISTNSEEQWPTICIGPHVETQQIDPLTAFSIYKINSQAKDPKIIKIGMDFLMHAISLGFFPALLSGYDIFHNGDAESQKNADEYLRIAAEKYNSHQAHFQIGLNIIDKNGSIEEALMHFENAAKQGNIYAKSFVGFILSPASDFAYQKKDPKRASLLFEEVLNKEDDPTTMHEYAKLLYEGIGIEKNEKRALELQAKATKLVPGVPDLKKAEKKINKVQKLEENEEARKEVEETNKQEETPKEPLKEETVAKPVKTTVKKSPEMLRLDAINKKVDALAAQVASMNEKIDLLVSLVQKIQK